MNDLINIEGKILVIRGQQVMLDRDLAEIYGYEVKTLNQQVKRNISRFPADFMFELTREEIDLVKSQIVTSPNHNWYSGQSGGRRKPPFAFTEQGIYMLATVLRGKLAEQQTILIMRIFKQMRHYFAENAGVINRLSSTETKLIEHDQKLKTLFTIMDKYKIEDKQGIFFQGQIFDAFSKFQQIIQKAKKEIILIDNYIDLTVLDRLAKKQKRVDVTIYTRPDTIVKPLAVKKFNTQYPILTMKYTTTMHDRFLIIDNTDIYHIGASLKDLGKKCFGFSRLEDAKIMIKAVLGTV